MKDKIGLEDLIFYRLAACFGFFIRRLPIGLSLWLARRLGFLAYIFYRKRRRIGYANLKAAFCIDKPPEEIKKLIRETFQHFAQVLFEIFYFPIVDEKYIERYITFHSLNRVREVIRAGRGAIILTGHFGNWEISGLSAAVVGCPQDVLARQQKHVRLNQALDSYRERYGRRVISKGIAVREIIRSIRANKIVAILSDQDGGADGCLVDFFGRLASTAKGAVEFASKFNCPILPNFCARKKGPFYNMVVEPAMGLVKTDDAQRDAQANLQQFTDILQSYIRRYPNQWLWLHKRWKTTPSRRIVILSDGKAGHLNQAKALARQIRRVVFEKAESDERVKPLRQKSQIQNLDELIYQEKIVEVKYKSWLHKIILTACSLFASRHCQGCLKCVKFCLKKDSYNGLISVYADIVVSCGSSTAALNRFMCMENMAKGIIVNKPGILPLSVFNLCVMPRHDEPPALPNVVITEGALNLMSWENGGESVVHGARCMVPGKSGVQPSATFNIGLLIGGDNKDFVLTEDDVGKVIDALLTTAKNTGAGILVTTSRRTSKEIEALVKAKLAGLGNCRLLVIANEKNMPEAVGGILGASDVVVVSGESVSMVSEAASSGKRVVVFELKTKKQNSRHARFLETLKEKGYIILCEPGNVLDAIEQALKDANPAKRLNDSEAVYEALKRIV